MSLFVALSIALTLLLSEYQKREIFQTKNDFYLLKEISQINDFTEVLDFSQSVIIDGNKNQYGHDYKNAIQSIIKNSNNVVYKKSKELINKFELDVNNAYNKIYYEYWEKLDFNVSHIKNHEAKTYFKTGDKIERIDLRDLFVPKESILNPLLIGKSLSNAPERFHNYTPIQIYEGPTVRQLLDKLSYILKDNVDLYVIYDLSLTKVEYYFDDAFVLPQEETSDLNQDINNYLNEGILSFPVQPIPLLPSPIVSEVPIANEELAMISETINVFPARHWVDSYIINQVKISKNCEKVSILYKNNKNIIANIEAKLQCLKIPDIPISEIMINANFFSNEILTNLKEFISRNESNEYYADLYGDLGIDDAIDLIGYNLRSLYNNNSILGIKIHFAFTPYFFCVFVFFVYAILFINITLIKDRKLEFDQLDKPFASLMQNKYSFSIILFGLPFSLIFLSSSMFYMYIYNEKLANLIGVIVLCFSYFVSFKVLKNTCFK